MSLKVKENKRSVVMVFTIAILCSLLFNFFTHFYDNKYRNHEIEAFCGITVLDTQQVQKVNYLVEDWEFYQSQLLSPEDFADPSLSPDAYVDIGEYTGFELADKNANPHGSGTYRLRILLDPTVRTYTLELPEIFSAYRVWVNEVLLYESGNPDPINYEPAIINTRVTFEARDIVEVVIAVTNYDHYYSGMVYPPAFGVQNAVETFLSTRLILKSLQCLFAMVMALSYLLLFLYGEKDKNRLVFSLLCFFYLLYSLYPLIHTVIITKSFLWYGLEDVGFLGMLLMTSYLVYLLFPLSTSQWMYRTFFCFGIFVILCSVILPSFSGNLKIVLLGSYLIDLYKIMTFLYLLAMGGWTVSKKEEHGSLLFIGIVFFAIGVGLDKLDRNYEPILWGWGAETGGLVLCMVLGIMILRQMVTLERTNHALIQKEDKNRAYMEEVVHDLKAPLSNMKAYLELTRYGIAKESGQEENYLLEVENQAMELSSRIDLLRELSSEEIKNLTLHTVNSLTYLNQVTSKYRWISIHKGITLGVEGQAMEIKIDVEKMNIALENLIMNSIRFTKSGGSIILEAQREGTDDLLIVRDTGQGVDEAYINDIFNRGFSSDRTHSGLGLHIVSEIAKAHHGMVRVESNARTGSRFIVHIHNTENRG